MMKDEYEDYSRNRGPKVLHVTRGMEREEWMLKYVMMEECC